MTYRGQDVTQVPPHKKAAMGFGRTFQNVGMVKSSTVLENLKTAQHARVGYDVSLGLIGAPSVGREERELAEKADAILELLGLEEVRDLRVGGLSYGTLKLLELGCALATEPDILLLDEPSSGMGPEEAHQLGERLIDLRQEFGLTMLLIEHHVPLVLSRLRPRLRAQLRPAARRGPAVGDPDPPRGRRGLPRRRGARRRSTTGDARDAALDAHPAARRPQANRKGPRRSSTQGDAKSRRTPEDDAMSLLEVEDLRTGYGALPVLQGISFSVEEGETAVMFGLNGAGKTTTVNALAGLLPIWSGDVRLDGKSLKGLDAPKIVAAGIGLSPEGRRVFPALSVLTNLRLGAWTRKKPARSRPTT